MGRRSFSFSFVLAEAFGDYFVVHYDLLQKPKLWIRLMFVHPIKYITLFVNKK